jgi:hypothetical protein
LNAFTGAYVITSGGVSGPKEIYVVKEILKPLTKHLDRITQIFSVEKTWKSMYDYLHGNCPGFGGSGFMAKEVLQDALLMTPFKEATDKRNWTPMGPGARKGLNRLRGRDIWFKQSEEKHIQECILLWRHLEGEWWKWALKENTQYRPKEESKLVKEAPILSLTAHDIQFQLCEFDKYERVRKGEGRPRSKYTYRGD